MCNKEIICSGIYLTEVLKKGALFLSSLFSCSRQGQNIFSFNYDRK